MKRRSPPCRFGRGDVRVSRLHGGITNENFVVADAAGRFVVRFGDDIPVHGVMRFNELAAARAAHAAGLSPEVVFAAPGVMVSRFLEGRSLAPEDVRDIRYLPRIVNLIRRCHYDVAPRFRGPILAFWVFQVIRSYVEDLRAHGARVVDSSAGVGKTGGGARGVGRAGDDRLRPQRSARRQHLRRRRAAVADRLGLRRPQQPAVRSRQPGVEQQLRRGRGALAAQRPISASSRTPTSCRPSKR